VNSPVEQWRRDAAAPFQGWDFNYLNGRISEAKPDWDYPAQAAAVARRSRDILDIDTGGGEFLSSLAPFPGRATAVEGFVPNLAVARQRLGPLGIPVLQADAAVHLPFEDGVFDLLLNRHGAIQCAEIHRVLKRGGAFLTQQVSGDNLVDLMDRFGAKPAWPANTLDQVSRHLVALGFDIRVGKAWSGPVTFSDVGALVYFLKAIPWIIEGFDVERDLEPLMALHAALQAGYPLQFTCNRFLIEAVKS
jgi:SAM-dependent methyltransferase